MSEPNPYAAPEVTTVARPKSASHQRPLQPTPLESHLAIKHAWKTYKANVGRVTGAMLLLGMIMYAPLMIGLALPVLMMLYPTPEMFTLVGMLVVPLQVGTALLQLWVFPCGIHYLLRVSRGQPAPISELFAPGMWCLFVNFFATVLYYLALLGPMVLCFFLSFAITQAWRQEPAIALVPFALALVAVLWFLFLTVSLWAYLPLLVDRKLGVFGSLETAWNLSAGNRGKVFGLWFGYSLFACGVCLVAILATVPIAQPFPLLPPLALVASLAFCFPLGALIYVNTYRALIGEDLTPVRIKAKKLRRARPNRDEE